MLIRLLPLIALAAVAPACAHVLSTTPITSVNDCPGFSKPLTTIIPQVTTMADNFGQPWDFSLIVKNWDPPLDAPNTYAAVCALSPDGAFLGGSTVQFTYGSRLTLHRTSGTDGLSLEGLVVATSPGLANKEFQLYIGLGGSIYSREPQIEFGQNGNHGQYVISAPAPKRTLKFFGMSDSNKSTFGDLYYLSSPGSSCKASVNYLSESGEVVVTGQIDLPAHHRVVFSPQLPKGMAYSAVTLFSGNCDGLYGMRLIWYPSTAAGGRSAQLTTTRYYEGD